MIKVLFVCPDNTFLGPVAKALLTHIGGNEFVVESAAAGAAQPLNAVVKQAMSKRGVEILNHQPKTLKLFSVTEMANTFHYIIPLHKSLQNENFAEFKYGNKHIRFSFDGLPDKNRNDKEQYEILTKTINLISESIEDFVVEVLDKRLR